MQQISAPSSRAAWTCEEDPIKIELAGHALEQAA